MQDTPYLLGFTAGELSPWLSCRFDLQAYQRGAALIRNFLVQPYGGLKRRQGTRYVNGAASPGTRLFPFRYSEEDVLMLEFHPGGVRFYENGRLITAGSTPVTVETPWTDEGQIDDLRMVQVNDVVYVSSPDTPPAMLQRLSRTNWKYTQLDFNPYPRETYTMVEKPLTMHIFADSTARVEAQEDIFTADMVDKEYILADTEVPAKTYLLNEELAISSMAMPKLSTNGANAGGVYHEKNAETGYYEFYTCHRAYQSSEYAGKSSAAHYRDHFLPGAFILYNGFPYEVCGDWELRTNGEWNATWEIWRSYDSLWDAQDYRLWQWTCIRSFEQTEFSARKNWELTGSEKRPCRMMIVCRSSKTLTIPAMMYFKTHAGKREYKISIRNFVSSRVVTGACRTIYFNPVVSFQTNRWSFGAIGKRNGYPRIIGFHQGRLWLGGIDGLPTTLLASAVGDFYNFGVGSEDDDALHLTLATTDQNRICWICPSRNLLVGTTDSEWILSSPDGGAVKATTATFSRQSSVGSADKPAHGVENVVFYVQRGGKRVREISYKLESDGFSSTDTSLLAEHLFESGVKEWAVQRGTCTRLWVLMNDGTVAVLTINLEQQITAWQRVEFPGRAVRHLATLPSMQNAEDEVWFVMHNATSNHTSIERITQSDQFMDGLFSCSNRKAPHLAGLAGQAYRQQSPGQKLPVTFDSTGAFTPPADDLSGTWYCGTLFASELETMPLERDFSFNTTRQLGRVRVRLLQSSPVFSYRASHATRWETYTPLAGEDTQSYTGSIRVPNIPSPGIGQGFALKVDGTEDFRMLGLTVETDYHGR